MTETLDRWEIRDADEKWDFIIKVTRDDTGMRPEESGDVYRADFMAKESPGRRSGLGTP